MATAVALAVSPNPTKEPSPAVVVIHPPTELAWILAGLSGLGRGGTSLQRETDYWRAAESWFGAVAGHTAVTALGADFNLPRLIGNAANHDFDSRGHLVRRPGSRPMWGDASGDLFTRYRSSIEAFVAESQVQSFLAEQSGALESVRATLAMAVDLADMQTWLEGQFSARPGAMEVYVSPVTGGWNFTNLDPVTPRLWVPSTPPPTSEVARFATVRGIFTEMDHNYVNPATARLDPVAYDYFNLENGWATAEAWGAYSTPELVVNEYMTYAAFVAYAQDRLAGEPLTLVSQAAGRLMERRGFPRFEAFMRNVTETWRTRQPTLEAVYPRVLTRLRDPRSWVNSQQLRISPSSAQ